MSTQITNGQKADDIELITKSSVMPRDMEDIRETDPIVIMRDKVMGGLSGNLLLREASYDNVRTLTVLTIQ